MNRRRIILTVAVFVATAASAHAFGSLVRSFRAPDNFPNGVAFLTNTVYINTNSLKICWETTTTGSVISSFLSPTTGNMGTAVGSIGGTLYRWIVSWSPQLIYRVVATTGSTVNSFSAPGSYPYGVAFRDASYIYYTAMNSGLIYLMHATTGSVYNSFPASFNPSDIAYDPNGYLWIVDGGTRVVRKCTLTGSTVGSFSVSTYGYPSGCGFGGGYVWIGINAPLHSILQFTSTASAVMPTSLGKVKTLFR